MPDSIRGVSAAKHNRLTWRRASRLSKPFMTRSKDLKKSTSYCCSFTLPCSHTLQSHIASVVWSAECANGVHPGPPTQTLEHHAWTSLRLLQSLVHALMHAALRSVQHVSKCKEMYAQKFTVPRARSRLCLICKTPTAYRQAELVTCPKCGTMGMLLSNFG